MEPGAASEKLSDRINRIDRFRFGFSQNIFCLFIL
jgi:hypothetical protein